VTRAEQETTVRWVADEDGVLIWTAQPSVKRRLEKAGYRPYPGSTRGGREVGWFYTIPLVEFRWRVGVRRAGRKKPSAASVAALAKHRAGFQKAV